MLSINFNRRQMTRGDSKENRLEILKLHVQKENKMAQ